MSLYPFVSSSFLRENQASTRIHTCAYLNTLIGFVKFYLLKQIGLANIVLDKGDAIKFKLSDYHKDSKTTEALHSLIRNCPDSTLILQNSLYQDTRYKNFIHDPMRGKGKRSDVADRSMASPTYNKNMSIWMGDY